MKPPAPFTLRPLQPADFATVQVIDHASFPTPTPAKLFIHELTENPLARYAVVTAVDHVVGYIGYWLMADEVHISTIAVHPDWRGRGLGELLLLHMLYAVYDLPVTLVTLEVREGNTVAQALYRKYQFDQVGRRRRYYRDTGEDAVLMTRQPLDAPYRNFLDVQQAKIYQRLASEPFQT